MINTVKKAVKRIINLPSDNQGFVLMSSLAIFLFIFVLCASIYAVGETIHQRIKMQNACDAAAYSAAVIQADGLSRMATINRAMAWSYVQMTNRQMDYITYCWLKLTCKRFGEDMENGKVFNEHVILSCDKELGWWALLEVAATAMISEFLDHSCSGLEEGAKKPSRVGHDEEGHGWWCGLEVGDRTKHNIRLNVLKDANGTWDKLKGAALDGFANLIFTKDNIESVLQPMSFIDSKSDNNEEVWAGRLGILIDYDKKNIDNFNKALIQINKQMNVSMKLTAENVLKSMLKDTRLGTKNDALNDYYISIHIPQGINPYDIENHTSAPESFFSPLHNTEADEMLFLNMTSPNSANKTLIEHFPTFLGGNDVAYGLDQWFIRGKANYSDEQEHCYDSEPMSGVTLSGTPTTFRNEGALGIQRVYKDTNLNETGAGFFAKDRKQKTGTHPARWVAHSKSFHSLPECCKNAEDLGKRNTGGSTNWYYINEHDVYEKLPDMRRAVFRGNHLMDLTNITNMALDGLTNLVNSNNNKNNETNSDSDDDGLSISSQDDIEATTQKLNNEKMKFENSIANSQKQKEALLQEKQNATPQRQNEIDQEITSLDNNIQDATGYLGNIDSKTGGLSGLGNTSPETTDKKITSSEQSVMSGFTDTLLSGLSSSIGNIIGQYLDIQPSTGNDPSLPYDKYPMCKKITKPTTALYSEYRWASCKWYCLTKLWTWSICSILGKDIYCDSKEAVIKEIDLKFTTIKIKGKGIGHFGWPKWFCGNGPKDFLFPQIPPLYRKNISGSNHGYMANNYDFTKKGFLRPSLPLWSKDDCTFTREEYKSCAMFVDGFDLNPYKGHDAWPALIRGHARIYGDDKEIFNNCYVGARCEPWVLNERFFDGEGTIVIGAAMKHTNPFVQLFNFLNPDAEKKATQDNMDKTVISAFDIPDGNYMWTMSAARAGVRHCRRNGMYDQERQYQITYDATSDVENLSYNNNPILYVHSDDGGKWVSEEQYLSEIKGGNNKELLFSRANVIGSDKVAIWNGCPCGSNSIAFKNIWNLCETDWDATLLPLRYAGRKATLKLTNGSGQDFDAKPLDEFENNAERYDIITVNYEYSRDNGKNETHKNDMIFGNGKSWEWESALTLDNWTKSTNSFINMPWKKANLDFSEDLVTSPITDRLTNGVITGGDFNLQNKIPEGKEEKKINIFTIMKDRIL